MRRTFVLSLGTAGCAAALHFRRRREGELRYLRRRLLRTSQEERPVLEQRYQQLLGAVRILAIDLDGTDAYRLPPPLDVEGSTWKAGETLKITLNPRDVIERFQSGQLPEVVEQVNPETLRGLDAENASGGARPNADLAFQVASDRIRSALRDSLVELLKNRQALTSTQDHGIRVFLIAGTFGGTGSGSYQRVKEWLLQIADELGVHLDVYPFLLVPGAHGSKDPANSYGNTFAVLKELAADGTGYCWRTVRGVPGLQRAGFRAPFLLSDINNAPGAPRIISESALAAQAGDVIYELTATALGSHLDAQIGDYGVAGTNPTILGEPRQARSIGLSTIFLDIERQDLWSRTVIALKFIETASKAAPEGVIRQDVRAFLEGNALVLGDGRNDLSGRLLDLCAAREQLSLTRLRSLFGLATQELPDVGILTEGRNRLNLALQQCGDFGPALQRHATELAAGASGLVRKELRGLLTDYRRGPASASLWLAVAGGVVDAMLAAAGDELGQLQAEVNDLDDRILRTEAEHQEELRGKGLIYRTLHAGDLSRAAAGFRADLEAWATMRIRSQAASSGIQVLNQLRQTIHQEIQDTAQPILAAIAAGAEGVREDQRRAVAHSLEFGCPNGLPLVATEADLVDLHRRCFPEVDEIAVINEFYSHLARQPEPASLLKDAEALHRFFHDTAPKTLIGARLGELNVIDELKRRFPDDAHLGSVLRERDVEAYERLPLVSTSEQTSGLTLVRLLGVDSSRLESIRTTLDKHQTDRSVRYLPVDTGDRQRLTFLQVRAVFPFSDWRGYPIARAHYESIRGSSESEKQHVLPGNRFLPAPGCRLTEDELVTLLVRAWVLGRLEWVEDRGWTVLAATDAETPVALGRGPSVSPQLAFRLAIDLVSSTSCFVRAKGPAGLRQRLGDFAKALSNGSHLCGLKLLPNPALLSTATQDLESEAQWWERNTHPASNGWQSARVER
jgi:hypothetical protein